VLHARLVVHRLGVDGVDLALRSRTLVAVVRDGSEQLDWEVVADCVQPVERGLGRCEVEMLCITGADAEGHLILGELSGPAVVVRFVDRTLVLRGDGPLAGLDPGLLQGSEPQGEERRG
jgi:hypothetical protein